MAAREQKSTDFYNVLGLQRECTTSELKKAYKKLAMKWHPDRYSASGNLKHVEEAKSKFQDIQRAYSVLSDTNKRFLYDVGVYDCEDDDDENGMGDFLNEMVDMMCQNKHDENRDTSFEEFQELFEQIFESKACESNQPLPSSSTTYVSSQTSSNNQTVDRLWKKRTSSDMSSGSSMFKDTTTTGRRENVNSSRRDGRKQKVSSGEDVSSSECSTVSA